LRSPNYARKMRRSETNRCGAFLARANPAQ
jgi:hypothetical protein